MFIYTSFSTQDILDNCNTVLRTTLSRLKQTFCGEMTVKPCVVHIIDSSAKEYESHSKFSQDILNLTGPGEIDVVVYIIVFMVCIKDFLLGA